MKNLLQMVVNWIFTKMPSAEERYLAQSVDAYDFEIRLQALERTRA